MIRKIKLGIFVTTCFVIYMFTSLRLSNNPTNFKKEKTLPLTKVRQKKLCLSNNLTIIKKENTLPLTKVRQRRDLLVIGILSQSNNICVRNALRRTLMQTAKEYKAMDVRMYFVLDEETPKLSAEQKVNQDIVFLNSIVHGYNCWAGRRWFGVKLYIWLKYVMKNFPNVSMLGRMDDDTYVCAPQIFDRLNKVKNDLLYYGYPTGSVALCPSQDCVDDMFIIIGRTLASRVVKRPLCDVGKKLPNCLQALEGSAGAHEFRKWTVQYKDIYYVNERMNNRMIWYYRLTPADEMRVWQAFRTWNFCRKYLLFHKATAEDIYRMDFDNKNQLKFGFRNDETVRKIESIANCSVP